MQKDQPKELPGSASGAGQSPPNPASAPTSDEGTGLDLAGRGRTTGFLKRALFLVVIALLAAAVPATAIPTAAAGELPGGRANFVVSTGSLTTGSTSNWFRLGTYAFDAATGKVSTRMHVWEQTKPTQRTGIKVTPDSSCSSRDPKTTDKVRPCEIMTAGGFTGAPNDTRQGTYELGTQDGKQTVTITWSPTWTDKWSVDTQQGLARLNFVSSTRVNSGYGYGSNAALTDRRAMSSVKSHPGDLRYVGRGWTGGKASDVASSFAVGSFNACEMVTWCLTYLQPSSAKVCQASGGCPHYGGGTPANVSSLQYYLGRVNSGDRRDALWHWCTCLAMERNEPCYTGNSHVKPLLQILDDNGTFRGWVGVEGSFSTNGVRSSDMLAVFAQADWVA